MARLTSPHILSVRVPIIPRQLLSELTLPLAERETFTSASALQADGDDSCRWSRATSRSGSIARRREESTGMGVDGHGQASSPSASSSSPVSQLSSSFPRASRLGGASASNGFASAWARGQRRRGESLDGKGKGGHCQGPPHLGRHFSLT